jgi:PRTRC genetic system protein B
MDRLIADSAIVLYKGAGEDYAEVHQIIDGEFQNARPLSREDLVAFARIADDKDNSAEKKCFPFRNILGFKSNAIETWITWICPAQQLELLFSTGIKSGKYYIPNLIFQSDGRTVRVYAIKQRSISKINKETKVYRAPFMNTGSSGSVCMGNVKMKKYKTLTEMIHIVETAFFKSKFTHTNYNEIVKGSLIDAFHNQQGKFDEKLLLEYCKLEDICEDTM